MAKNVNKAFEELLTRQRLTAEQEKTAKARTRAITDAVGKTFAVGENVSVVGSYARGTLCRTERDIDLLAPLSVKDYWEHYRGDSRAFLYWFRDHLNERYSATTVSSRRVAVKMDFTVIAADIVPCFLRQGGGYVMPDGRGGWMATNPPFHTKFLADADAAQKKRLKPLIRLVKAWNIANGHHLSSFHIELMVERMKRGHPVGEWSEEVAAVLGVLAGWVNAPFEDPWSDGGQVDTYLTSDARAKVVRMIERDAERAARAEEYRRAGKPEKAFERWSVIYDRTFPSYG